MNHAANVLAIPVNDIYDTVVPGAFEIQEEKRIAFICPCGCGDRCVLPFFGRGWTWDGNKELPTLPPSIQQMAGGWTWDGNKELPTLTPSIQQMAGCKWHGHLIAGVWQPTGNSGQ